MNITIIGETLPRSTEISNQTSANTTSQRERISFVLRIFRDMLAKPYYRYFSCCYKINPYLESNLGENSLSPQEVAESPFAIVPLPIKAQIFSFVEDRRYTASICKEWRSISATNLASIQKLEIEEYIGKNFAELIYQESVFEEKELTDYNKLILLFKYQLQRLSIILDPKKIALFLKTQPAPLTVSRYKSIDKWIKDFNFILLGTRLNSPFPAVEARKTISKIGSFDFDIAKTANILRESLKNDSLNQTALYLDSIQCIELPPEIGLLKNLQTLVISSKKITAIPAEIGKLEKLKILNINNTQLKMLPPEIGNLKSLTRLNLADNPLKEFIKMNECYSLKSISILNTPLDPSKIRWLVPDNCKIF